MESKQPYVWVIFEECHGPVGIWDNDEGMIAEVNRLYAEIYPDEHDKPSFFFNGEAYGVDEVYAAKNFLNVPY